MYTADQYLDGGSNNRTQDSCDINMGLRDSGHKNSSDTPQYKTSRKKMSARHPNRCERNAGRDAGQPYPTARPGSDLSIAHELSRACHHHPRLPSKTTPCSSSPRRRPATRQQVPLSTTPQNMQEYYSLVVAPPSLFKGGGVLNRAV